MVAWPINKFQEVSFVHTIPLDSYIPMALVLYIFSHNLRCPKGDRDRTGQLAVVDLLSETLQTATSDEVFLFFWIRFYLPRFTQQT